MSNPIDITIDSGPDFTGLSASFQVSGTTNILDGDNVGTIELGTGGYGFGDTTTVSKVVYGDDISYTFLNPDTGVLYVSSDGINVASGGPTPQLKDFDIVVVAHPGTVDQDTAETQVVTSTYNPGLSDTETIVGGSGTVNVTAGNLTGGQSYTFAVHGYEDVGGYITTDTRTGFARLDPEFESMSVIPRITEADVDVVITDNDSTTELYIVAAPVSMAVNDVRDQLMASTYAGEYAYFNLPIGEDLSTSVTLSNLNPSTSYNAIVVAVDNYTGGAITRDESFLTYSIPSVDVSKVVRTYDSITAQSLHSFAISNVDLTTVLLPNTAEAIDDFLASGTDPMGTADTVNYPGTATGEIIEFGKSGLGEGDSYIALARAVPALQPNAVVTDSVVIATAQRPSITIGGIVNDFFRARATVSVVDPDDKVNVYVAIYEDTYSEAAALSNLLADGSSAFPGAIVAVSQSSYNEEARRDDLVPDNSYRLMVAAVEAENTDLVNYEVSYFSTFPYPDMHLAPTAVTENAIQVDASSIGMTHDMFVRLTPFVVNDKAIYDPSEISATEVSNSNTHIILDGESNIATVAFSNLTEHTKYGIVLVAAENGSHRVIDQLDMVVKTSSLPDIDLTIESVGTVSVDFRVTGNDLDSPFRILTAVATDPFDQAKVEAFVAEGQTYVGGGIIDGSQTDWPNDVDERVVNKMYTVENLESDVAMVAIAIAVDGDNQKIRWTQQSFTTLVKPVLGVSLTARGESVEFDIAVTDATSYVNIRYNVYTTSLGLTPEFVKADPGASFLVSTATGIRHETGLSITGINSDTTYYLAVLGTNAYGYDSVLSVSEFTTDPTVSTSNMVITKVTDTEIDVHMPVHMSSVTPYTSAIAVFPYGTAVDDDIATSIFDASASNMIDYEIRTSTTSDLITGSMSVPEEGTRVTVVGAVKKYDQLAYSTSNLYTRVTPNVAISDVFRTTDSFSARVVVAYVDPDEFRNNVSDVIVTPLPEGTNVHSLEWLNAEAASNLLVPEASVDIFERTDSVSYVYSASNLLDGAKYDFVVKTTDSNLDRTWYESTLIDLRSSVQYVVGDPVVDTGSIKVTITASLDDGPFELYSDIKSGTEYDESWEDLAVLTGLKIADNVQFYDNTEEFQSLVSNQSYVVVFVAVDKLSGQRYTTYKVASTTAISPDISILQGSILAKSTEASFVFVANDNDSPFDCYVKVYELDNADPVNDAVVASTISEPDFTKAFNTTQAPINVTGSIKGLDPMVDYRMVAVAVDRVTGSNAVDYDDFRTIATSDSLPTVEYDGEYLLSWRSSAVYSKEVRGVQMANGKNAFRSRVDGVLGVTDCMISGNFDFNSYGGYTNNVVGAFDSSTMSLYEHSISPNAPVFTLSNQILDMRTGILTSKGTMSHADGNFLVEQDIIPLRHMPYCTLTMYRATPESNVDVRIYNEVAPSVGLDSVKFTSSTVYQPSLDMTVPVFGASGNIRESSHTLSISSVAMFNSNVDVSHVGYNTFRDKRRGFDVYSATGLEAGTEYSWAVLSAQASSADFPRPDTDTGRMLMQVVGSFAPSGKLYDAALRVRSDHVRAWSKAWMSSATLTPKAGLTLEEDKAFYRIKRALTFAQFQLLSNIADHGTATLNPLHMTSVDVDGNLFWNRELWIIPALLYSRPAAVRSLIENRYDALRAAKTLAAAQGHEGAKFPYVSDIMSYELAPFWDVESASYVFNTALVAVATWDYFRVTHDRDWLISKGYPILSSVADYVSSIADVDEVTGKVIYPDILDVNGERVTDASFTVYICRTALKAAIEASYELTYPKKEIWMKVFSGSNVSFHSSITDKDIIKHHSDGLTTDHFKLLEPLMVLHPHYVTEFFRLDLQMVNSNQNQAVVDNANFYSSAMTSKYEANPVNSLLLAACYAQANRGTGTYSESVQTLLDKCLDDAEYDIWGSLGSDKFNDISLSAMLYLTFVTSFAGLHVSGGVAQSGFYYVPFGIRSIATNYLPKTWKSVVVTSGDKKTHNILNKDLYP